jgi:transcriptional regulator with XRE-family HTH domain
MVLSAPRPDVGQVSDRAGSSDPRLRQFGAHLRQLREKRGLTIEQLAEVANVGGRQLARVEAGRASPSLLWLYQVADGLELSVVDLLP